MSATATPDAACGKYNYADEKTYRSYKKSWDDTSSFYDAFSGHAVGNSVNKGSILAEYTKDAETGECSVAYSGSATAVVTYFDNCPDDSGGNERIFDLSATVDPLNGNLLWSGTDSNCGHPGPTSTTPQGQGPAGLITETWTDVEPTEDLLAKAEADLASFDDDFDDPAGSFFSENADHTSVSIRKSRYRLFHDPVAGGYLKVWLKSDFAPDDGGALVETPLSPYEWTGSPILAAPHLSPTAAENRITGSTVDLALPTSNGEITVYIEKYSYVRDYEPVDDAHSGYPS